MYPGSFGKVDHHLKRKLMYMKKKDNIGYSYNWHIYVKDGVTPNWACSEQLVTSLKTRQNSELRWECVVFQGQTLH